MTTILDKTHAAMLAGGDVEGMAFYRALGDVELFLVLQEEAAGDVVRPKVFDLTDGQVLLAFDSEERLAGFSDRVLPYVALPGRVIAGQMAGQGLSLGLNLGSGAASEVILPPEALDWLLTMLDLAPPVTFEAQVERFEPPMVPQAVLTALTTGLSGVKRGFLAGARFVGGKRGQVLILTGVDPAAEAKVARAVTEALAFSGLEAAALDIVFLADSDPALTRLAAIALMFEGPTPVSTEAATPFGPGRDPDRPPILR